MVSSITASSGVMQGYLSLLVSCLILVSPWAKFAVSAEPVAIAIDRVTARIPNSEPHKPYFS